jgi:hypothetical protein
VTLLKESALHTITPITPQKHKMFLMFSVSTFRQLYLVIKMLSIPKTCDKTFGDWKAFIVMRGLVQKCRS